MTDTELLRKLFPGSPAAEKIYEEAGSFARLLNMSAAELVSAGLDPETAEKMNILPELARRYFASANETGASLTDADAAEAYLKPYFTGVQREIFVLCCLNGRAEVTDTQVISEGRDFSVGFDATALFRKILAKKAKGVILAHNHPNGFPVPSRSDLEVTRSFFYLLKDVNTVLCDHLIFAGDDCLAMSRTKEGNFLGFAE